MRIAAQGGLWQAAVFGFGGLSWTDDGLRLDPCLPESWQSLAFRIQWRGSSVHVRLGHEFRRLTATLESGGQVRLHAGGHAHTLLPGHPWQARWGEADPATGLQPAA